MHWRNPPAGSSRKVRVQLLHRGKSDIEGDIGEWIPERLTASKPTARGSATAAASSGTLYGTGLGLSPTRRRPSFITMDFMLLMAPLSLRMDTVLVHNYRGVTGFAVRLAQGFVNLIDPLRIQDTDHVALLVHVDVTAEDNEIHYRVFGRLGRHGEGMH